MLASATPANDRAERPYTESETHKLLQQFYRQYTITHFETLLTFLNDTSDILYWGDVSETHGVGSIRRKVDALLKKQSTIVRDSDRTLKASYTPSGQPGSQIQKQLDKAKQQVATSRARVEEVEKSKNEWLALQEKIAGLLKVPELTLKAVKDRVDIIRNSPHPITRTPDQSQLSDANFQAATSFFEAQKYDDSDASLINAVKSLPAGHANQTAFILLHIGKYDKIGLIDRAIKFTYDVAYHAPLTAAVLHMRALLLGKQGLYEEAFPILSELWDVAGVRGGWQTLFVEACENVGALKVALDEMAATSKADIDRLKKELKEMKASWETDASQILTFEAREKSWVKDVNELCQNLRAAEVTMERLRGERDAWRAKWARTVEEKNTQTHANMRKQLEWRIQRDVRDEEKVQMLEDARRERVMLASQIHSLSSQLAASWMREGERKELASERAGLARGSSPHAVKTTRTGSTWGKQDPGTCYGARATNGTCGGAGGGVRDLAATTNLLQARLETQFDAQLKDALAEKEKELRARERELKSQIDAQKVEYEDALKQKEAQLRVGFDAFAKSLFSGGSSGSAGAGGARS
ncbi:hypothetical protein HDV00_000265 [Rhizophlyctis rosea]|nr:hypothetical protein HDV00_000265 [Rhizophlyctis rosea]